jgi:hypothetical protein
MPKEYMAAVSATGVTPVPLVAAAHAAADPNPCLLSGGDFCHGSFQGAA